MAVMEQVIEPIALQPVNITAVTGSVGVQIRFGGIQLETILVGAAGESRAAVPVRSAAEGGPVVTLDRIISGQFCNLNGAGGILHDAGPYPGGSSVADVPGRAFT